MTTMRITASQRLEMLTDDPIGTSYHVYKGVRGPGGKWVEEHPTAEAAIKSAREKDKERPHFAVKHTVTPLDPLDPRSKISKKPNLQRQTIIS